MNEDNRPVQLASLRKRVQELQQVAHQLEVELNAVEAGQDDPLDDGFPPLDLPGISRAIQSLASCSTQEEILDTFLEEVGHHLDRAVLFLETDGQYTPWKSLGFIPESIEDVVVESSEDPVARAARELCVIYVGEELEKSFAWLNNTGSIPQAAICLPLKVGDSIPLVLYADANHAIAVDSLELLTHLTELVVKNHFLAYLAASDSHLPTGDEHIPVGATEEAVASSSVESSFLSEEASESAAHEQPVESAEEWNFPETTADLGSLQTELPPDTETETAPSSEEEFVAGESSEEQRYEKAETPASSGFQLDEPEEVKGEPEETSFQLGGDEDIRSLHKSEEASETPLETEPSSPVDAVEELLSEEPVPPIDSEGQTNPLSAERPSPEEDSADDSVSPATEGISAEEVTSPREEGEPEETGQVEASGEPTPEPTSFSSSQEEAIHREAQRFARLLVSEIRLYNEEEVELGRQDGNLYSRLQKDIDRSRQMYEKRVHPSVKSNTDYFHNELIRILARNDGQLLGSGYPGPRLTG